MLSRIARSLCAVALVLTAAVAPADEPTFPTYFVRDGKLVPAGQVGPAAPAIHWISNTLVQSSSEEDPSSVAPSYIPLPVPLQYGVPVITVTRSTSSPASHTPPAPEAQAPSVPSCHASAACQLLSSDAFADGADPEALPECRPLPELHPTPAAKDFSDAPGLVKMNFNVTVPCSEPDPADDFNKLKLSFGTTDPLTGASQFVEVPSQHMPGRPGAIFYRFGKGDEVIGQKIFTPFPEPNLGRTTTGIWSSIAPSATTPPAADRAEATPAQTAHGCSIPTRSITITNLAATAPAQETSSDELTPLQHLQKAADHLDAAGRKEEAARIRQQADAILEHARHRLPQLRKLQEQILREIKDLERLTGTSELIQLNVSMLEVDNAKLAQFRADNDVPEDFVLNSNSTLVALPAEKALRQLQSLQAAGVFKVIAQPTLVTRNGQEGSVRSGGEFPIMVPQQDGTVKIEFRDHGVHLTATPHLLGNNRLRLELAPEISERDFTNAVTVGGNKVPGVRTRRLNTDLQMSLGETVVIGGLQTLPRQLPLASRTLNLPEQISHYMIQLTGGELNFTSSQPTPNFTSRQPIPVGNGKSFIVTATPTLIPQP